MKILHLMPYLPTPANFGGAIRMYHIFNHLQKHHDVTVAGYAESGDENLFHQEFPEHSDRYHFIKRPLEKYHRLLQFGSLFTSHSYSYNWSCSRTFESMLNRLVDKEDFDLVLSEFPFMAHFDLQTDTQRVLDSHNVEYDNFHRMSKLSWSPIRKAYYAREYKRSRVEEIAIFNRQDAIFATSGRDADIIKDDAPSTPVYVIPNGVDTRFFQSRNSDPEPWSMVFTGAMGYVPNFDGIMYFLDNIFPHIKRVIPDAKIYIVGNNPPENLLRRHSSSVIVTGFVDDVRPWIERASVYVVPLNMGGGTRLKVVEALSMKKPIVTTSIGCEGIDVENDHHLLIRDDPEAFAEAVVRLMNDKALSRRITEAGNEMVIRTYDWGVIGSSIDKALEQIIQKPVRLQKNRRMIHQVAQRPGVKKRGVQSHES